MIIKENVLLPVASLVSLLLSTIHVTQDITRGADKWGPQSLIAVLVLGVLLYGTLMLPDRRSGLIMMLFIGFFSAAMPVLHRNAKPTTGFLFIWGLFALGAIGILTMILAVRGLLRSRRKVLA